ncbi:MAG: hypothetical protein ABFD25_07255 [Clostridiaceae bacterium]
MDDSTHSRKAVLKYAGAFVAWVIGSGFATGQEVLQFFTSYGYWSYGVVAVCLAGFLLLGETLMTQGYAHRAESGFNQFQFYCGKKLGTFYGWLIPVTLVLLIAVLISGAGSTFTEYYGVNHYIGSAIMAVSVLCSYLIGFERLTKVVSMIGPVIIVFTLVVGSITVILDYANFPAVSQYASVLSRSQAAPHWTISAFLCASLNFLSGSTYFTQLGITAQSRKGAKYGALLGAAALMLAIMIMNTAILLDAEHTALLDIPVLYLAKKLSYTFGAVFSIVLILGMFCSCSAMMWSVCSRFSFGEKRGNRCFAVGVSMFTFVLGLFSFSQLVSVFYPLVGYLGLIYIGCVLYKRFRHREPPINFYEKVKRF